MFLDYNDQKLVQSILLILDLKKSLKIVVPNYDYGKDLADLIHEISKIKDLKRIRISSIEVTELSDKMLLEIEENEKIVNHFYDKTFHNFV